MTSPNVDVHVGMQPLTTVRCSKSRRGEGATMQLDRICFRDMTDDSLQQIADAIELYLIRKNQRRREQAKPAPPAAAPVAENPELGS